VISEKVSESRNKKPNHTSVQHTNVSALCILFSISKILEMSWVLVRPIAPPLSVCLVTSNRYVHRYFVK